MAGPNRLPGKLPHGGVFLLLGGIFLGNTGALTGKTPLENGSPQNAHWAFQKPANPPIPSVGDTRWIKNPIDAFILRRLEKAGLRPALPQSPPALLRRVTVDLTGLPPTPEEVEDFLRDSRPDAYIRVVDRLLASSHYGERWAQHWLDVIRYAESNGYELDAERPHAWHYRDYVIRSLNSDKPYDRFLIEQLAGDQLAKGLDPKQNPESFIASGFNRCGPIHLVSGNTDPEVNRQEVLTEMTSALGSTFLGLTIGCARCHDHKFDPISQKEYYQLQAFFVAVKPKEIDIASSDEQNRYDKQAKDLQAQIAPLQKKVAALEGPYRSLLTEVKRAFLEPQYHDALEIEPAQRTPQQKKLAEHAAILIKVTWDELVGAMTPEDRTRRANWRAQIHALEAQMPAPPSRAWAVLDDENIPATHILKRGDPKRKGAEVQPAIPEVLAQTSFVSSNEKPDRLALARWLTHPDHPLTARVLVNRIWQHHFGSGLVATPNDFGLRGSAPSHPELLDWLARELISKDWSIKHLHRLMVLSNTYQQASRVPDQDDAKRIDPDNRLLWRMNRSRLQGEAIRDCMLAIGGTLNQKLEGPMVRVPLEAEVLDLIFTEDEPDGVWKVTPDHREHTRRSIYLFNKRNVRLPLFEAFDQPDTLTSCPVRPVSTFAPQGLILLNGPFVQEQSKILAMRLLRECGSDVPKVIDRAYRLALARSPLSEEITLAQKFLNEQMGLIRSRKPISKPREFLESRDPAFVMAVVDFCLAMLNRNEFLYIF
jgi:hypothetical protein